MFRMLFPFWLLNMLQVTQTCFFFVLNDCSLLISSIWRVWTVYSQYWLLRDYELILLLTGPTLGLKPLNKISHNRWETLQMLFFFFCQLHTKSWQMFKILTHTKMVNKWKHSNNEYFLVCPDISNKIHLKTLTRDSLMYSWERHACISDPKLGSRGCTNSNQISSSLNFAFKYRFLYKYS